MSGRTAFGVNLGFKKLPDGSIAMSGPLVAPAASFAGTVQIEGDLEADGGSFAGPLRVERGVVAGIGGGAQNTMRGRGLVASLFGSSSAAACSDPLRANYLTSTGNVAERVDGFLFAANARANLPFQLAWNGGYANETTAQIIARYQTDIVAVGYPATDIEWFLLFANDFPVGTTLASLKPATYNLLHSVLGRGKKFGLIIPHTRNPSPVPHTEYIAADAFGRQLEIEYPGEVFCVSHYSAASPTGGDTPVAWLKDGMHLNSVGVEGVAPAWQRVARMFGGQFAASTPRYTDFGGTVLGLLTGDTMTSSSGVTVEQVEDYVDDRGARPQWRVTSSADVAEILLAAASMDTPPTAGMTLRIWADLTVEAVGANTQYYHAGALFRGAASAAYKRFGCSSSLSSLALHAGRLIRGLSHPFSAVTAHETGTLGARAGNAGSSILLREVALLQVPSL